jgi:hypothetical protein
MSQSPDDENGGFPWYVKAMLALALLVIVAIIVVDLLEFATAV